MLNILVKHIKIKIRDIPEDWMGRAYSEAIFKRCAELNGTVSKPKLIIPEYDGWIQRVYDGTLIL
jgi:hypothetical protein